MNNLQTTIEAYIIAIVKRKRLAAKYSQRALSIKMGVDESYVGQAESLTEEVKYNMNHINELAKIFECPISDFFPDPPLENNCILEYQQIQQWKKEQRQKLREEDQE